MTKVTEDYVSYEIAKLLNEKGFKIDTNNDYWKIGEDNTMYFMSSVGAYTSNPNIVYAFYRPENSYPCPTLQMTMKWIREMYHIEINITFGFPYNSLIGKSEYKYFWSIVKVYDDHLEYPMNKPDSMEYHEEQANTYEEAIESALKYILENLI